MVALSTAAERARIENEIEILARDVQKFRIESQKFLAGQNVAPPEELRESLARRLRDCRTPSLGAAESFRLGSLEAQFNSLGELYGRRLREREQSHRAAQHAAHAAAAHDPEAGIAFGPAADAAALQALFTGLYAGAGAGKVDFDSFRGYIQGQVEAIRQKTGCSRVVFRVANEDGRLKLKAKPLA